MRKPWWWRRSLIVLAIAVSAFMALPVAQAQQVFVSGAVVALEGTPHLWIADDQGVLHWGGDTRALANRHINWSARTEVSLAGLRALPKGDPWLSAGLLKQGDPIYLVKWETEWPQPRLFHIQSIADVEIFGINETNYGRFVLDVPTWEARYGISVASLQRAELPAAVPGAGTTPTTSTTPSTPATPATGATDDVRFQQVKGFDVGIGTMELPQGTVTLRLQFGGWGDGPVTVTYEAVGVAPIQLLNNAQMPYFSEIDISVPRAGIYTFRVTAPRDWRVWVGRRPGLPSVPLPLDGCRTEVQWRQTSPGIQRAEFRCGSAALKGTSYSDVNTDDKFWAVWFREGTFLAVTSTGSGFSVADTSVPYQVIRGYNNGAGELSLPASQVTIMIEYGNWNKAPLSLSIRTPGGEHIRPLQSARVPYLSTVKINVAQAGTHGIQVNAEGDWRLWVGIEVDSIVSELEGVNPPVRDCSTQDKWKQTGGFYRAVFKCPSFELRAAHYPGLNTSRGFWVIWTRGNALHDVTFHRT